MTADVVPLESLLQARVHLIASIVGQMPENHRRFLVGFERGEPDWTSLNITGAEHLPAVQWRQKNLVGLSANQRTKLVSQLEQVPSERQFIYRDRGKSSCWTLERWALRRSHPRGGSPSTHAVNQNRPDPFSTGELSRIGLVMTVSEGGQP
jgi:hypothetical protein